MIQINLIPDIKREYLKAQQMKHTVVVAAILCSIVALVMASLLFGYVRLIQPQHRANLQQDIDEGVARQQQYPDGTHMVTVQGVLEQIGALQDKKLITSRLFTYIGAFTPRDVAYTSINFDATAGTLVLSGQATTFEKANELANNVKSARFTYRENDTEQSLTPFASTVFNSLSRGEQSESGKSVTFELAIQVDPKLFSQAIQDGALRVDASSDELLLPSKETLFSEVEASEE